MSIEDLFGFFTLLALTRSPACGRSAGSRHSMSSS
jgi:hypothetical protein